MLSYLLRLQCYRGQLCWRKGPLIATTDTQCPFILPSLSLLIPSVSTPFNYVKSQVPKQKRKEPFYWKRTTDPGLSKHHTWSAPFSVSLLSSAVYLLVICFICKKYCQALSIRQVSSLFMHYEKALEFILNTAEYRRCLPDSKRFIPSVKADFIKYLTKLRLPIFLNFSVLFSCFVIAVELIRSGYTLRAAVTLYFNPLISA